MGAPGAGKGTQARLLQDRLHLPQISTGDIFRALEHADTPLAQEVRDIMERGQLVPDELTIQVVKERTAQDDCQNGYILDGFPRTPAQAEGLARLLDELGERLQRVILVEVAEDELVRRLSGRIRGDGRHGLHRQRRMRRRPWRLPGHDHLQEYAGSVHLRL